MKTHWSQGLHQLFKQQGIRQVSFVPDAGHAALLEQAEALVARFLASPGGATAVIE